MVVLILVVVDNGLVPLLLITFLLQLLVLILVVVDNGLVRINVVPSKEKTHGLNPCCSGQWSSTPWSSNPTPTPVEVLILVVVDNGLVLDIIRHY